jgi:hypothetical protein
MNIKEMTKEQLIVCINDLNKKIEELKIDNTNAYKANAAARVFD